MCFNLEPIKYLADTAKGFVLGGAIVYTSASFGIGYNDSRENIILSSQNIRLCDSHNNCVPLKNKKSLDGVSQSTPLGGVYALNKSEVYCLAKQIMQEAQKGVVVDMAGVAHATINRVKSREYPNSICSVISYRRKGKKRYDMTWYGNLTKRNMRPSYEYVKFARDVLAGSIDNPIGKSTNWFNIKYDDPRSFNGNEYRKTKNAAFKLAGTPHIFIDIK